MLDYKKELNPRQYDAVMHQDGPAVVISGAGTGKTRVITFRLARLLQEKHLEANQILLLTFTRKASEEMKERAGNLVGRKIEVSGGTFHSFAVYILKKYIPLLNYSRDFTIYDKEDCLDLIKLILSEHEIEEEEFPKAAEIYFYISAIKNKKMTFEDVNVHSTECKEKLLGIIKEFEKRKRQNNALDYDDLIHKTVKIFKEHVHVLKKIASDYKYIMVDEYQDTNHIQNEMLKELFKENKNILVVGDDMQSIYSFRGAQVTNILNFPKEFEGAQIYKLEMNYRSKSHILDFVNSFSKQIKNAFEKKLFGEKKSTAKVNFCIFQNKMQEAEYISNKIIEDGDYSSWGVLSRYGSLSSYIQAYLARNSIPYVVFGGIKFAEKKSIKDILAYLKIIQNIKDTISVSRVLRLIPGIGGKTCKKILDFITQENIKFENIEKIARVSGSKKAELHLQIFIEAIKKAEEFLKIDKVNVFKIIENYYIDLVKLEEEEIREVGVLKDIFLSSDSLDDFLTNFSLYPPSVKYSNDKSKNFVTISTVHSAKGLEFDKVFLIGVSEGIMPYEKAKKDKDIEEEMRLFYVACTRAKDDLILTHVMEDRWQYISPSSFLRSIDEHLVEEQFFSKRNLEEDYDDYFES